MGIQARGSVLTWSDVNNMPYTNKVSSNSIILYKICSSDKQKLNS